MKQGAELGAVVRTYAAQSGVLYASLGGPLIIALAVAVAFAQRGTADPGQGVLDVFLPLLGLLGLVVTAWGLLHVGERLVVYENGFVHRKTNVVRWDQVGSVRPRWQRERDIDDLSGMTPHDVLSRVTVGTDEGHMLVLTRSLSDLGRICADIEMATLERMMRQSRARLASGEIVRFGPVSVRRDGVGQDDDIRPWSQVGEVDLREGRLTAKVRDGHERFIEAPRNAIPNLHVLGALLGEFLSREALGKGMLRTFGRGSWSAPSMR